MKTPFVAAYNVAVLLLVLTGAFRAINAAVDLMNSPNSFLSLTGLFVLVLILVVAIFAVVLSAKKIIPGGGSNQKE